MNLKTSLFGYDMDTVLSRFERLNLILDQIEQKDITKGTAINLFDALIQEPIKRRLTGFNRKSVDATFADIRRQLVELQVPA